MINRQNSCSDSESRSLMRDFSELKMDNDFDGIPPSPAESAVEENRQAAQQRQQQQQQVGFPPPDFQSPVISVDASSPTMNRSSRDELYRRTSPSAPLIGIRVPPAYSTTLAMVGPSNDIRILSPRSTLLSDNPGPSLRAGFRLTWVRGENGAPVKAFEKIWVGTEPFWRFRWALRSVILMLRTLRAMSLDTADRRSIGPGVDPRQTAAYIKYGQTHKPCHIEVTEYNSVRRSFQRLDNRQFVSFMSTRSKRKKDTWVKVRWINIVGVSWDILSTLAEIFDIPPLALADILHQRGNQSRSRSEYCARHLFIRLALHKLKNKDDMKKTSRDLQGEGNSASFARSSTAYGRAAEELTDLIKEAERVSVDMSGFFIFLTRKGTVISISQSPDNDFTAPITVRLRDSKSGLRRTADPSILVQSLLHLAVDHAMEVVDDYELKIQKLEQYIHLGSSMKAAHYLNFLSGDLKLREGTLEPIKTVIYELWQHDAVRQAALIKAEGWDTGEIKAGGYMSHISKVHLAESHNYMEFAVGKLEVLNATAENLINFTFNMASYEMNRDMRYLTMATIICLPLSLITGYFGMSFKSFSAVNTHSELFFWEIAIPVTLTTIGFLLVLRKMNRETLDSFMKRRFTTRLQGMCRGFLPQTINSMRIASHRYHASEKHYDAV